MALKNQRGMDRFALGGGLFMQKLNAVGMNFLHIFIAAFVSFALSVLLILWAFDGRALYEIYLYSISEFWASTFHSSHPVFFSVGGKSGQVSALQMVHDLAPLMPGNWAKMREAATFSLVISGVVAFVSGLIFFRIGTDEAVDSFIRGQQLVSEKDLAKVTIAETPSPFRIGKVHIPQQLLARNILMIGSMGTGKSQAIYPLLETARKENIKSLVWDASGEFLERFYDPTRDFILNPLDTRCAPWTIFNEVERPHEYLGIAQIFTGAQKADGNGKVWAESAGILLGDLLRIESETTRSMRGLIEKISMPLDKLSALLRAYGLPSAGIVNEKNPKASESVRMTLAACEALSLARLFGAGDFSARKWGRGEYEKGGWLFISSTPAREAVIKAWAGVWAQVAILGAMEGRPNGGQKIETAIFLDELPALPRMGALDTVAVRGRKYGIMTVAGVQNASQLDEIYGPEGAQTLVANFQSKAIFRVEDPTSSERAAKVLGQEEILEAKESVSRSIAQDATHGATLDRSRSERYVVTPTQIQTLPDLHCFLKVAGDHPVAEVTIPYLSRPVVVPDFLERDTRGIWDAPLAPVPPPGAAPVDADGAGGVAEALAEAESEETADADAEGEDQDPDLW